MKTKTTLGYFKSLFLAITFGLAAASCKNDHPLEIPDDTIKDFHQTAVTQFINVGNAKIAYRVLGDQKGIPLILVPSLGSTMDDWDPAVTNGLAQKHQVILFDIQGAGSSQGDTPDKILEMAKGVALLQGQWATTRLIFWAFQWEALSRSKLR